MRGKTMLASFATLTFLCGFVFATFSAIVIGSRQTNVAVGVAIGAAITVLWATIVWLVSPLIMDMVQRFLYSARNITLDELSRERPAVAAFVSGVCQKHRIKIPSLKLIEDQTPQAYCYGSYANNARLVTTRGLMQYLNDEELKAVYAHELGHIVHRDFIVMTVAATLLNILWNTYIIAKNIRGKNNSRPGYPIALIAFVFWWIGQYILLYLSRTREYYADEFAGAETGNPNALSMALVKIAYGITRAAPTPIRQKLLGGTRAMGISDFRGASGPGLAYQVANQQAPQQPGAPQHAYAYAGAVPGGAVAAPGAGAMDVAVTVDGVRRIEKVMLFDLYNPWGTVCELGSTHPLTGKRIRALGQQAQSLGQHPLLSFDAVDAHGQAIDRAKMYGNFFFEVTIYFLPHILGSMFFLAAVAAGVAGKYAIGGGLLGMIVFGIGLGMFIKGLFRYVPLGNPSPVSVLELMSDPYASPLRGRPVVVQGTVVGRSDAGNKLGEDMTLEDREGGIIALNYESLFGFLGNWWFAARRVGKLIGQSVQATGWFRRGVSQQIDLKTLQPAGGESIGSWTAFWGRAGGVVVLAIGLVIAGATGFAFAQADSTASTTEASAATAAATSTAAVTSSPAVVAPGAPHHVAPRLLAPAAHPKPKSK